MTGEDGQDDRPGRISRSIQQTRGCHQGAQFPEAQDTRNLEHGNGADRCAAGGVGDNAHRPGSGTINKSSAGERANRSGQHRAQGDDAGFPGAAGDQEHKPRDADLR
jgi:hypothetical protein